jgi:hypothetical protein
MKDKLTDAQRQVLKSEAIKSDVMRLLGWSEFEYGNYKFEQGISYLNCFIMPSYDNSPFAQSVKQDWINQLIKTPMFWSWWKNQWAMREELFVNHVREFSPNERAEFLLHGYHLIHDSRILSLDIHPHRIIMDETYHKMVKEMAANK